MITCFLMGGLGNQLFEIFTTMSYALLFRHKFAFLDTYVLTDGNPATTVRYTYWKTFLKSLSPTLLPGITYTHVISETDFPFNDHEIRQRLQQEKNFSNVYLLRGYYQSYKYFEPFYDMICKIIGLERSREEVLQKVAYDREMLKQSISLHFRIGDYKSAQHVHPVMTKQYYERCLHHIQSHLAEGTVLYFCEDDDVEDVNQVLAYLVPLFPRYTFQRGFKDLADWEQMLLMSSCHHNIIANSSFSWWGAYFNPSEDKVVCYPSMWFGPFAPHNTKDLCPRSWTRIQA